MKKIFLAVLFSIFTVTVVAQNLKNPRIEISGGSSYSSGNYLLCIDPGAYIRQTDVQVGDIVDLQAGLKDAKMKIEAFEKQFSGQQKKIEALERLIATQQRQFEDQQKKLDAQQRKLDELARKVK